MLLGIVGAFVGGTLFTLLSTGKFALAATAGFNIGSIIVAIIGAMIVMD